MPDTESRIAAVTDTSVTGLSAPAALAALESFDVISVTFGIGDIKQLVRRNPRRTGMTIWTDPLIKGGIAILPRGILATEATTLGRMIGPILMTSELFRTALLSEWWAYSAEAGVVTVYDYYRNGAGD